MSVRLAIFSRRAFLALQRTAKIRDRGLASQQERSHPAMSELIVVILIVECATITCVFDNPSDNTRTCCRFQSQMTSSFGWVNASDHLIWGFGMRAARVGVNVKECDDQDLIVSRVQGVSGEWGRHLAWRVSRKIFFEIKSASAGPFRWFCSFRAVFRWREGVVFVKQ